MPMGRRTRRDTIEGRIESRRKSAAGPVEPSSPVVGPSSVGNFIDSAAKRPPTGTRTPPPQPRTEPTAPTPSGPGAPSTTRPSNPVTPQAGRDIGGAKITQDSKTFARTGGREAARRGISGSIQSGRSLFNNPGQNQFRSRGNRGRRIGRQKRGLSLTRGTGGSPGQALAAPTGTALGGGEEKGRLEEMLDKLKMEG